MQPEKTQYKKNSHMLMKKASKRKLYAEALLYVDTSTPDYSFERSFALMKEGADTGDPAFLNTLGSYYENGIGTKKDGKLAFECYRKASELGLEDATYNLGTCYFSCIGTRRNGEKSFRCFM